MLKHAAVTPKPVDAKHLKTDPPSTLMRASQVFGSLAEKQGKDDDYTLVQSSDGGATVGLGLIRAAARAYSRHHGLVLRPDDVWQAIVTQLSFYVQGRAEKLRSKFVAHEGQKQLTVHSGGTLFTAPYADICRLFLAEIRKNVKDAGVVDWLEPGFSTTTPADSVASAISVMATFQAYFSYKCCLCCGLPSVELRGTPEDWHRLLAKLDRLPEFDAGDGHLVQWAKMLRPVVAEMVATKEGKPNMDWWQRIANYVGGGSGPDYLTGWITVFCCFDHEGKWQGDVKSRSFWRETIDSEWPIVDTDDVPTAVLAVPMVIDDNGEAEYDAILTAGQVCCDRPDPTRLQPRTDWALHVPTGQLRR